MKKYFDFNYWSIKKPFCPSDCPQDCVLYDNDIPGQDDPDDDDNDRDEGQTGDEEARSAVRV